MGVATALVGQAATITLSVQRAVAATVAAHGRMIAQAGRRLNHPDGWGWPVLYSRRCLGACALFTLTAGLRRASFGSVATPATAHA